MASSDRAGNANVPSGEGCLHHRLEEPAVDFLEQFQRAKLAERALDIGSFDGRLGSTCSTG
jgi:hypothetical protein